MERAGSDDLAAAFASALDWWAEAGVDCAVAEAARDWLKAPALTRPTAGETGQPGGAGAPLARGEQLPRSHPRPASPPQEEAEAPGPLPDQLDLFQQWLRSSETLPYAAAGAPRICPAGDPASGLMILVAMPSGEDCAAGTLLSGAAGRLFDRMLAAIGRSRETIYLAGLSCLRPPAGRFDKPGANRCADIARHHVALAAPRALLVMGDDAAKALVGGAVAQTRGRKGRIEAAGRQVETIVTFHPDFLLRQPAAKARAWADLQLLMEVLG